MSGYFDSLNQIHQQQLFVTYEGQQIVGNVKKWNFYAKFLTDPL